MPVTPIGCHINAGRRHFSWGSEGRMFSSQKDTNRSPGRWQGADVGLELPR
jgi:hypothetical protein